MKKKSVTSRRTSVERQSVASTFKVETGKVGEGHVEKERVLDDAYVEYCRLREAGSVNASLFCAQYPAYRKSLRKLIDVHEMFDQVGCDEPEWPEPEKVFLGFAIHRVLGIGAIARVYLASELSLRQRLVALKVSQYGSDEAETLGKLIHPNIVPVHSATTDAETGMTAVCMPYLGSSTLADVLEEVFSRDQRPLRGERILAATRRRELLPRGDVSTSAPRVLRLVRLTSGQRSQRQCRGTRRWRSWRGQFEN